MKFNLSSQSLCVPVLAGTWLCFAFLSPLVSAPGYIFWNPDALAETRTALKQNDPTVVAAWQTLSALAETALEEGPWSVTDKPFTPPSGDKRDYMSVGPFWWPNPDTPDGLPYIRRDGEVNPERQLYDNVSLGKMANAVRHLGLAYALSGEEVYAGRAALFLRTWFLEESTRMNPHLEYGQAIPGITEGRFIGIIDTVPFVRMLDSALLLRSSDAWSEIDHTRLQEWFREYLHWLLASPHGIREGNYFNNHGTWHDVQTVAFALFCGKPETATALLEQVPRRRIMAHLAPDGRQPYELERTLGLWYSIYNLRGLTELAILGNHAGVDLWSFADAEGRSILRAFSWLAPFLTGQKEFPFRQIRPLAWPHVHLLYRMAASSTLDLSLLETLRELPPISAEDLMIAESILIYPVSAMDGP